MSEADGGAAKRRGTRGDSCQDTLFNGEVKRSQIKRQRTRKRVSEEARPFSGDFTACRRNEHNLTLRRVAMQRKECERAARGLSSYACEGKKSYLCSEAKRSK